MYSLFYAVELSGNFDFALQNYKEKSEYANIFAKNLLAGAESGGKGGDDEAAEGDVILIRLCAYELRVRFGRITFCEFIILRITVLPESEPFRIGHLLFALFDRLGESIDNVLLVIRKRPRKRMSDSVRMCTPIPCAHHDTFFAREFTTKMVKR